MENPEYVRWAPFKPGASATYKEVTTSTGPASERELTITLLEVNPAQAVVEIRAVSIQGSNRNYLPVEKLTIPARIPAAPLPPRLPAGSAPVAKPAVEQKEEMLEAGGTKLACQMQKTTATVGPSKLVSSIWTAPAVPGGMVKLRTEVTGEVTSTTELTLASFKTANAAVPVPPEKP